MLDTVIVQSANPLTLNVTDADPSEILVVKNISGLTSAKVGLYTGDFAGEGSYYQGRRAEALTPVINLKMNPDYANDIDVSDIRDMLYRAFYEPQPGSDGVKILLKDDRRPDRYFVGYTEDINTDQFSQDRSVQISMKAMDAYLFSDVSTSGNDAVGWASLPVTYDGSAKTGLQATLKVNSATGTVTFDLNGTKMVLQRAFVVGDIITLSTVKGNRYIRVNGTDIMAAMSPTSKFVLLDRTDNVIKTYGVAVGDGAAVMTDYSFRSQWWGI